MDTRWFTAVKLTAGLARNPRFRELTPDQRYIVKNIGEPGFFRRLVWSLNFGNGKSVALDLAILKLALKYPGILIFYGRNHYTDLKKNNLRLFFEIVPQSIWKYKMYGGNEPKSIVFPNGSVVQFMGFGDPGGLLGGEPGAVFIEEVSELDIAVWDVLEGRVRQTTVPEHALTMMAVGNPRGHYPLYRKFVLGEGMDAEAKKSYLWYKGDPMANKRNLPKDYYENMLARYPKELQERFVLGSDDTHAGQIYPMFNREIHVQDFKWQDHWTPYVSMDYGKVDPTAVLFGGFDPYTGDVYVLGEYYRSGVLVDEHVRGMVDIAERIGFPYDREDAVFVADSNIMDQDGGNGKSIQQWFAENGWVFNPAKKRDALLPGIEKIQNLLCPLKGAMPKFHIHARNCPKTIEEFWMYEWEQPKGPVEAMRFKEAPRDDWNHCMDSLRYMVNSMPVSQARQETRVRSVWEQMEDIEEGDRGNAIIWNPLLVKRPSPVRGPQNPLLGP